MQQAGGQTGRMPQAHDLIDIPLQTRDAQIVPSTWRDDDSTVEAIWTTGARRRAYDWMTDQLFDEELVVDESAVDMSRFDAGAVQVLDGHRADGGTDAILGIATRGWIADGNGHAQLRLRTSTPELAAVAADVKAGLIRAISFGYSVQRYEITRPVDRTDGGTVPLYRAVRWTPQEISFVAVPADPNAGTRSEQSARVLPCELVRAHAHPQEPNMPQPNTADTQVANTAPAGSADTSAADVATRAAQPVAAPAANQAAPVAADIAELCVRHGVPQMAAELIRSCSTVDAASRRILDSLATRDAGQGGHLNVRGIRTERDETETLQRGLTEAIQHRLDAGAELTDNGRQYRGLSLLEMGREYLRQRGEDTRGMDRMTLAGRMLAFRSGSGMHTTSDFGNLLGSAANRRLRQAYDENPSTYQMWARRAPNAPDFREINVVQLSGAPDLLKVNEHAEFTYGTVKDGAEKYSVITYGRIVSLTRQAIVNDDLRGFDRMITAYGAAASRLENRVVYAILTANAAMSDSVALFAAATGARKQTNLQSGGGSVLSIDSLAAGRKLMRLMKGINDEELNIVPAYLIVPAALENAAYQLTSSNFTPATAGTINEFRAGGRTSVEPIVEPLLDAASATAWYLAARATTVDTVEYAFLDGADGPVIETKDGFEVDGLQIKCRHDFGAKAVDHRGLHKSAGA